MHAPNSEKIFHPVHRRPAKVCREIGHRKNLPSKARLVVIGLISGSFTGRHAASVMAVKGNQGLIKKLKFEAELHTTWFSLHTTYGLLIPVYTLLLFVYFLEPSIMTDKDEIDLETLQARIDLSMSFTHDLVSSWVKPTPNSNKSSSSKNMEKILQEEMRRPPR